MMNEWDQCITWQDSQGQSGKYSECGGQLGEGADRASHPEGSDLVEDEGDKDGVEAGAEAGQGPPKHQQLKAAGNLAAADGEAAQEADESRQLEHRLASPPERAKRNKGHCQYCRLASFLYPCQQ